MKTTYVVPIVCMTPNCKRDGGLVNYISNISEEDLEGFYEGYDDSESEDLCPDCGELGIAIDPLEERLLFRLHPYVDWRAVGAKIRQPSDPDKRECVWDFKAHASEAG